jgi:hypothetical protein
MRSFQFGGLFLTSALVSARADLLGGVLQNLGVVQNDQPGQYIKGDPSKGDVRSPCPALNVLANHGYMYVDLTCLQTLDC